MKDIELARNLVRAIDVVCAGPLETMRFLQSIADAEIGSEDAILEARKTINWTTPSGFPVEYAAWGEFDIDAHSTIGNHLRSDWDDTKIDSRTGNPYQSIRVDLRGKEYTDKPKIRSFMSGISPNFIHSMDASHMSKVIKEWGGSFGPVHDSFSVHAGDVYDLLEITKKEFIKMYDYDNFFEEIERMILTDRMKFNYQQPGLGQLEIREVMNSDYFFA